jgi:hypothetical protein
MVPVIQCRGQEPLILVQEQLLGIPVKQGRGMKTFQIRARALHLRTAVPEVFAKLTKIGRVGWGGPWGSLWCGSAQGVGKNSLVKMGAGPRG